MDYSKHRIRCEIEGVNFFAPINSIISVQVLLHTNDGYQKTTERKIAMNTLGKLEQLLLAGEITEDEYKERKEVYVETILEIYCLGIITKEQMYEKLNE